MIETPAIIHKARANIDRSPYGSEKSWAQIKTIGQERQHPEQENEQAKAAEYCNYL
jgi:hypothetical protein